MIPRSLLLLLLWFFGHDDLQTILSFPIVITNTRQLSPPPPPHYRKLSFVVVPSALHSTFASDRSEYYGDEEDGTTGSTSSGSDEDDMVDDSPWRNRYDNNDDDADGGIRMYDEDEMRDVETEELSPVPLSKNAGNTFLALVWDRLLHPDPSDVVEMHEQRVDLTEQHVMYIRKRNLYNSTFNTDSMVDIPFSYQILSSDLQRVIGHAMCMESSALHYAQEALSHDPIVQHLTGGDITNISLYRWRHIRDSTLRMDDGRFGFPCMCLGLDRPVDTCTRTAETQQEQLEYLIRSQRVIKAGPLHPLTVHKEDNWAIGDVIFFNALDRDEAVAFAENLPLAKAGAYQSLRVHFYNTLDVTGKFVTDNMVLENPTADMKEAMEAWGYPVDDQQTPWLNW